MVLACRLPWSSSQLLPPPHSDLTLISNPSFPLFSGAQRDALPPFMLPPHPPFPPPQHPNGSPSPAITTAPISSPRVGPPVPPSSPVQGHPSRTSSALPAGGWGFWGASGQPCQPQSARSKRDSTSKSSGRAGCVRCSQRLGDRPPDGCGPAWARGGGAGRGACSWWQSPPPVLL